MSEPAPTQDELIRCLSELCGHGTEDAEAMTADELRRRVGCSRAALQTKLRDLHAAGRLVVSRKMVSDITGIERPQPAYRIRPEAV